MTEFKISCPNCQQHLLCNESYRGVQFPCPNCGATISVPPAAVPSPPPGLRMATTPPAMAAQREARPHIPPRPQVRPGPKGKSWLTSFLLAWFLGGLGVDRFYNGRIGLGIGKLLTNGLCGLWSLIDVLLLLFKQYQDAQGNTLRPAKRSDMIVALSVVGTTLLLGVVLLGSMLQGVKSELANLGSMGGNSGAGFASPEAVFEAMKADEHAISLYPPEERPLFAYTMVAMARFMSLIESDENRKKEQEQGFVDLMSKYNLADTLEFAATEDIDKIRATATSSFAGVNLIEFWADLEAYMEKYGSSSGEGMESTPVSMEGLRIDGDEAKATVHYSDETERPVVFIKSGGGWFVSFEKTQLNPEGAADMAEGGSTGLPLIITFDDEASMKRATAKGLLEGVTYDRSLPATLEPTENPLQAKLDFYVPDSVAMAPGGSDSVMETIKGLRGVKDVELSWAVEMEAAMKEFGNRMNEELAQAMKTGQVESAAEAPGVAATPGSPMPAADSTPRWTTDIRDEPRALRFDGVKDWLVLSPIDWQALPAFTFEVWVRDWNGTIGGQGKAGDPENSLWLGLGKANDKNQYPTSGWESNARNKQVRIGPVPTNRWVHFAMVFDGKNQSFYLDGQLKNRVAAPRPGPFDMRRSLDFGGGGSGLLRSARISSTARYDRNFHPSERWTPDSRTLLLLEAGNREGNILKDSSSQGNNALIRGAPLEEPASN